MNNKGFMMAEVVVVAAIVMATLSSLYMSYGKIYSSYSRRLNYYDVRTLYDLAYYRDTNTLNFTEAKNNSYVKVNNSDSTVLLIYNNLANLNSDININGINATYVDYISYVSSSIDLSNTEYVLLMERCNSDAENCKYAYLEVSE